MQRFLLRGMSTNDPLRAKLRHLPDRPGVYLMKDAGDEILYVGKAKSLRSRVRSYFTSANASSLKTRELVRKISDFETIVVDSEADALILENNLIKEYQPRFNINLRDDKSFPYIKVTLQEPFPRVSVTRRLQKDGARYFGPYTDVRRMRQALTVVKKLYTVRSCHFALPNESPERPCLDYHIGRCKAPCVLLQSEAEYRGMIDEIVEVLEGRVHRAATRLRREMEAAAASLEFERAAELRDAISQLEELEAHQKVLDIQGADRDLVAFARDGDEACGVLLRVREGKLLGREAVFVTNLGDETDQAVAASIASRIYLGRGVADREAPPPEILFSTDFPDRPLLEIVLDERTDRRVRTHVPRRGAKVRLIELAEQNARHLLEEHRILARSGRETAPDALYELQDVLGLETVPRRIVCFDVSHTQGSETVASAVVFDHGRPHKAGYRRFRITGGWGNDDFRSMHEAVTRYFRRQVEERSDLPELILVDGGKGQLNAARAALEALGSAHLRVISLAKRAEEVFVPGHTQPLRLQRRSPALRLLQRVRDEAHRFAISYNRHLRTARTIRSELSSIPGVGERRQRQLLEHFGSLRGVALASEEQIGALPGFSGSLARNILDHARRLTSKE
jgi:excinuclease ABC subunit C